MDAYIVFTGVREEGGILYDITLGKEYKLEGANDEGYPYFLDDVGDKNFACVEDGMGLFYISSIR